LRILTVRDSSEHHLQETIVQIVETHAPRDDVLTLLLAIVVKNPLDFGTSLPGDVEMSMHLRIDEGRHHPPFVDEKSHREEADARMIVTVVERMIVTVIGRMIVIVGGRMNVIVGGRMNVIVGGWMIVIVDAHDSALEDVEVNHKSSIEASVPSALFHK